MATQAETVRYFIWGVDQSAYGPVELHTLISWIKDERVLAETWVFNEHEVAWRHALDVPELQMFSASKPVTAPGCDLFGIPLNAHEASQLFAYLFSYFSIYEFTIVSGLWKGNETWGFSSVVLPVIRQARAMDAPE